MTETLISILAEHNVPINFADHITKLVSNKLVFTDSVFLRACAARAPCSLKVVIARNATNFFSRNFTSAILQVSSIPKKRDRFSKIFVLLAYPVIFLRETVKILIYLHQTLVRRKKSVCGWSYRTLPNFFWWKLYFTCGIYFTCTLVLLLPKFFSVKVQYLLW